MEPGRGPRRPGTRRFAPGRDRGRSRPPGLRGAGPRSLHRGDVPAARQELISAQRLRPLLTYAMPHLAVQARIELTRVHLALADMAGARTLMREIDELLRRRPDLGTLVGEAQALRARLSEERGPSAPGASSLTAAELRLLPMLATHLSFPEIAAELFLSRTPSSRRRCRSTGSWAPPHAARRSPGPVSWGSWRGDDRSFTPSGDGLTPGMRWNGGLAAGGGV